MDSKSKSLPKWLVDRNYKVKLTDVAKYRKPKIHLDYIKIPIPVTK